MQVIVDNLLTTYETKGTGAPVLFLHGWGDTHTGLSSLAKKLKGYKVVLLDLPGFGHTQAPNETWGLNNYADFVAKFLAKIDVHPVAIVAHSNGGAIALRGLATDRLHTDKLVLLASAGIRDEHQGRKKVTRLTAKALKVGLLPLPKRLQTKIKRKAYKSIGSDLFVAEHLQETFKKVVTDDVLDDAAKVTTPTLLVYGSLDKATPVRYGQKFADALKKSELKVIEGAGHFIHIDRPDIVEGYIKEFLA